MPDTKHTKYHIIAIDGHSSCGKSTLAKDLAKELGYTYIDSGAMYRACSLYFIEHNIDLEDLDSIIHSLEQIQIEFIFEGEKQQLFLNGRNVESRIRLADIADIVSYVARIPVVRQTMVRLQRSYSLNSSVVMDGRDIGSVVFPAADLKIFLTADIETRTQRRYKELIEKGIEISYEEVQENLVSRDKIDSTRKHSPLIQVEDALLIDNSKLNRAEQLQIALKAFRDRVK